MKKVWGFTLIELLIVVAIIAILAAIAVPNFLDAQVRAKVSRVRADQRSVSVALEAYYVDNNTYPAWGIGFGWPVPGCQTYNYYVVVAQGRAGGGATLPSFLMNRAIAAASFKTLTTPVDYVTRYPADPFASIRGETFGFYSVAPGTSDTTYKGGIGWILWSYGPDTNEYKGGRTGDSPYLAYNPTRPQPSRSDPSYPGGLVAGRGPGGSAFTYDPTNGTVSAGDIWRVKD